MTGYHLRIGYNSDRNQQGDRDAFEILKLVVAANRVLAGPLVVECLRGWPNCPYSSDTLREYADVYAQPVDLTLTIREPDDEQGGEIVQLASGGGVGREIKEAMRRAFCRMVIFDMHCRGIEVSLVVA